MTRTEVERILEVLGAAYPRQVSAVTDPDATITAYHIALSDVPWEVGQRMCEFVIRNNQWLPTPAEARGIAIRLASPLPDGDEAWGIVLGAIRRYGFYNVPEFTYTEISQAVAAIGWRNICMSEEPDRIAERFVRAYNALVRRRNEAADVSALALGGVENVGAITGS